MLGVGEGLFVAAGKTASLSAGSGTPSILLYFLLAPAAELDRSTAIAPATVTELYRTVAPIPDLKPGRNQSYHRRLPSFGSALRPFHVAINNDPNRAAAMRPGCRLQPLGTRVAGSHITTSRGC